MDLHYGICYYLGKNKTSNIERHYSCFSEIQQENKYFWVVFNVDSKNDAERDRLSREVMKSLGLLDKKNVGYLHDYNWGGTIAALFRLYKEIRGGENKYMAFFEEDFVPITSQWFDDARKYLGDYYYIGEGTIQSIENCDLCQVKVCDCRHMVGYKYKKEFKNEVWTDGGFYFSSMDKWNQIYHKIGIFHKGDRGSKYDHGIDGIDIGEVGFPSHLFNNNMRFAGLYRRKYFIHN